MMIRIKGFILFIIALVMLVMLSPLAIVSAILSKERDKWFHGMAYSIDQFGNVMLGPLMNMTLIEPESEYKFGNPDETISSVLGKNKIMNTLTWLGLAISNVLHQFDYNHVEDAIEWFKKNKK